MKLFLSLLLISNIALAQDIKVSIIDSGLDLKDPRFSSILCKNGHKDFTGKGIQDNNSHGTHIAGLISQYSGNKGYCLIILKYYEDSQTSSQNIQAYLKALFEASTNGSKFINFSGGGPKIIQMESLIIQKTTNSIFVVAAGNENKDISLYPYFPASYPFKNIIVVGNLEGNKKAPTSNYGINVLNWENGTNVYSTLPNLSFGPMTGTSQATAIHTGKLIKKYVETH